MIKDRFVHHRQLLLRGAKDYGFVYAIINRVILLSILLKQWVPNISIITSAGISFSLAFGELIIQWCLGIFFLRSQIISKTAHWGNLRNPLFIRLSSYLKAKGF